MSVQSEIKRVTVPQLRARKGQDPIVCLTAYTTPVARLLDPHVDLLMVGDSLGMVVYGLDSTLGVTLEMMIGHGQAVVRGSKRACVVIDMPFGTYQESPELAVRAAARLLAETGAQAVKLDGGAEMAATMRRRGACWPTPRRSPERAPFPWWSRGPSRRWPVKSPPVSRSRPSGSAPRPIAMVRC